MSMQSVRDIRNNPYKADFPLLAAQPELAFLDSAATSQRPASVLDAQRGFYESTNANALRGLYRLSVEATEAIAASRAAIARFIGADDPSSIIFGRNASEMLNLVALTFAPGLLQAGDEVCISIMEHHSNLISWQQVCKKLGAKLVYLYPDENGIIAPEEMSAKITSRTKILAITQVSNVLGIETPLVELGRRIHEVGGFFVVDGAQSLPHISVNLEALGCDFFVFSAHKALGPFGIGVLWGRKELLEAMPPLFTGGEMIDTVSEQEAVWAPLPEKFEAGTQDAAGIVAAAAGLRYLEGIGHETLMAREAALVQDCMEKLAGLPFIQIIGDPCSKHHIGVISFNVENIHPHDVASILDEHNVAIRAGHHCAQPLLSWLGISSCCRASLAFYNDANDVDALITGLNAVWRTFNG